MKLELKHLQLAAKNPPFPASCFVLHQLAAGSIVRSFAHITRVLSPPIGFLPASLPPPRFSPEATALMINSKQTAGDAEEEEDNGSAVQASWPSVLSRQAGFRIYSHSRRKIDTFQS